jgi:hypothetical protein
LVTGAEEKVEEEEGEERADEEEVMESRERLKAAMKRRCSAAVSVER